MPNHVVCPTCQQMLSIPDAAPAKLMCPRCLTPFDNPAAAGAAVKSVLPTTSTEAPALEMAPVPSVSGQVSFDTRVARIILVVLGITLTLGILTMTRIASSDTAPLAVALAVVMLVLIVRLVMLIRRGTPAPPKLAGATLAGASSATDWRAGMPIEYRRPGELPAGAPPRGVTGAKVGAFFGGFFAAILVCAGGFILLAATVNNNKGSSGLFLFIAMIAVVAVAIWGGVAGRTLGWRGFGPGVLVGLILGMMALGPCAMCYMATLMS